MKTDKFNNMISAFQCDFTLAKEEDDDSIYNLQELIESHDEKLMNDISLLEELEWMLRNGKAEIHIVEENE